MYWMYIGGNSVLTAQRHVGAQWGKSHVVVTALRFRFTFYSPQSGHLTHDVNPGVKYLIAGGHSYVEQNFIPVCSICGHPTHHQNIYLCRKMCLVSSECVCVCDVKATGSLLHLEASVGAGDAICDY